jgi:hypothetical protein
MLRSPQKLLEVAIDKAWSLTDGEESSIDKDDDPIGKGESSNDESRQLLVGRGGRAIPIPEGFLLGQRLRQRQRQRFGDCKIDCVKGQKVRSNELVN